MLGRFKSIRYGPVLFAISALIALAMVALLGFEWTQRQALKQQVSKRVDSVTAPAFLLDREFLRFVSALDVFVNSRTPPSAEDLGTRLDILLSKVETLRESPGSALLLQNAQVGQSVDKVVAFARSAERALSASPLDRARLRLLLFEMQAFSAESQALGNSADLLGAKLLESQTLGLLEQNLQILWLTGGQLLLLVLVGWGLVWRSRVQQREESALKLLNEELARARQAADRANVGKSLFLANMSHELRTPFNGVMGLLSLLSKTPLNPEQADLVHVANDSAHHLSQLLNDILDLSALESGNISVSKEALHIPSFLRGIEATFQPLAAQKNLQFALKSQIDEDLWVQGDSTRKRQILFNLIHNAIKFTQQGGVVLHARTVDQAQQRWLELRVEDTGIGMDEEALGQLFQRFFQVDSGLSRQFSGVGLGLQISLSLARRLGGDITVQSQSLVGSIFTVRLPLVLWTGPALPLAGALPLGGDTGALRSLRILVAEDHPVNRKYLSILLQRLGHEATFCDNGKLALNALVQGDYELVLMDIHMPVMDGLTATRAIRALPWPHSQVPIIALTADVLQEARDQAKAAGVNAFIAKPVKQEDLEPVMAEVIARAKAAELQLAI
jgi:signal transduction histidine kinase/CheY-like chemotaxis protein